MRRDTVIGGDRTEARLLYAQDIAGLLGWGTDRSGVQRARRWMRRNGMIDRDGRRYVTTRTRLREAFPAAYLDLIEELC
jgi:hypothetical protein